MRGVLSFERGSHRSPFPCSEADARLAPRLNLTQAMRARPTQFVAGCLALVLTGVLHAAVCIASWSAPVAVEAKCCQEQAPADTCRNCILLHPPPAMVVTAPAASPVPGPIVLFDRSNTTFNVPAYPLRAPPTDLVHMKCQLTT